MSDYKPIACETYDLYEIAIMRRQKLQMQWLDNEGQSRDEVIVPLSLMQFKGGEFLIFASPSQGGEQEQVRLDWVKAVHTVKASKE